jgi:5'-methylthioadenosine phosphorylase
MSEELIGIIGGTGLGDALAKRIVDAELNDIDTPFGKPSTAILVGRFGKRKIAFLSRHGEGHKYSPSKVPFAANIFALKKLGVRTVISSGAVGSLVEQIAPGDLVIVDQFIDKTFRRTSSFFGGFGAVHCELANPTCGRIRDMLIDSTNTREALIMEITGQRPGDKAAGSTYNDQIVFFQHLLRPDRLSQRL